MVVTAPPGCQKVVVDAGALIKLQRFHHLGAELYSPTAVLREIKDEKARAFLATLPQEIKPREPSSADMAFAKNFARETGDIGFLSQNDLELIALTVQMSREDGITIRERPSLLEMAEQNAGFSWGPVNAPDAPDAKPKGEEEKPGSGEIEKCLDAAQQDENGAALKQFLIRSRAGSQEEVEAPAKASPCESQGVASEQPAVSEQPASSEKTDTNPNEAQHVEDGNANEDVNEDEEDSDEGEWITASNMHRVGRGVRKEVVPARVACATADYSVQNVLLQMGIAPITFDGYQVRTVKLWGVVCRGCFFFSRETTRVFCPKCGHDTLDRVPLTVEEDGSIKVHDNRRRRNLKGTVYSVPKPRGGRGWQPIFAEDQLLMGGRDREIRRQKNLNEAARSAKDPFDYDNAVKDWTKRAVNGSGNALNTSAANVQAGYGRRNPNANNHKFRAHGAKKK